MNMTFDALHEKRAALIRDRAMGRPVDPADIAALDDQMQELNRKAQIDREVEQARQQIDREQARAAAEAEFAKLEQQTAEAHQAAEKAAQELDAAVDAARAALRQWQDAQANLSAAQSDAGSAAQRLGKRATSYALAWGQFAVHLISDPTSNNRRVWEKAPRPHKAA